MDYNYINYLLMIMSTNTDDDFSFERLEKEQLTVNLECPTCHSRLDECNVSHYSKIMDYVTFYCSICKHTAQYSPSFFVWTLIEP